MPTMSEYPSERPLKWYQGLDRYCWIVLIVAALGWLFDTMDQNIYNLVRAPSLKEMLHPHRDEIKKLTRDQRRELALSVDDKAKLDASGANKLPPAERKRSEEHTSELQSQSNLVCRLLLEKKKNTTHTAPTLIPISVVYSLCSQSNRLSRTAWFGPIISFSASCHILISLLSHAIISCSVNI